MAKKERYVIGIFVEGAFIHTVCLVKKSEDIRIIDAEISKLVGQEQAVGHHGELIPEFADVTGNEAFDLTADLQNSDILVSDIGDLEIEENATIIQSILNKYSDKKYTIAISLAEPQVYYAYFNSDWNLKGDKLRKRVIDEMGKLRPDAELLKPEDINLVKLNDGRLMAIIRDGELEIIRELELAVPGSSKRIQFIESAEISLVNLIKKSYNFPSSGINLIVYIGHEFSRLTFIQGHDILNISYIIGVGLDAENIVNTIYSRILLEQDNLNVNDLDNIILAGQAYDAGIQEFLVQKFSEDTNIEYINLHKLGMAGNDPLSSRFAVPIGAAMRALSGSKDDLYSVDVTPRSVKERKKKFKVGLLGWFLLALISIVTFFTTVKIGEKRNELTQAESTIRSKKVELAGLQEVETRLNMLRQKLDSYDRTLGVLDSIPLNNPTWSQFLNTIATVAQKTRYIWITDAHRKDGSVVLIKGYSVYRNKIPIFANSLSNARLKNVEVQEIREKTVYSFEIEVMLNAKTREAKDTK